MDDLPCISNKEECNMLKEVTKKEIWDAVKFMRAFIAVGDSTCILIEQVIKDECECRICMN